VKAWRERRLDWHDLVPSDHLTGSAQELADEYRFRKLVEAEDAVANFLVGSARRSRQRVDSSLAPTSLLRSGR
jgi:hypothetical protein